MDSYKENACKIEFTYKNYSNTRINRVNVTKVELNQKRGGETLDDSLRGHATEIRVRFHPICFLNPEFAREARERKPCVLLFVSAAKFAFRIEIRALHMAVRN